MKDLDALFHVVGGYEISFGYHVEDKSSKLHIKVLYTLKNTNNK